LFDGVCRGQKQKATFHHGVDGLCLRIVHVGQIKELDETIVGLGGIIAVVQHHGYELGVDGVFLGAFQQEWLLTIGVGVGFSVGPTLSEVEFFQFAENIVFSGTGHIQEFIELDAVGESSVGHVPVKDRAWCQRPEHMVTRSGSQRQRIV